MYLESKEISEILAIYAWQETSKNTNSHWECECSGALLTIPRNSLENKRARDEPASQHMNTPFYTAAPLIRLEMTGEFTQASF